jgi:hypothetical protein
MLLATTQQHTLQRCLPECSRNSAACGRQQVKQAQRSKWLLKAPLTPGCCSVLTACVIMRCCQAAVRRGPQDSPLQDCRQLDTLHTHTPLLPSPACGAGARSYILVSFRVLAGSRPAAFRAPHRPRMDRPAPAPAIPSPAPARTPRHWGPQRKLAQLECCDVLNGCVALICLLVL